MKDIHLPKMFTNMRDTLLQAGWYVAHSDPADTYVVLGHADHMIRCVLHYMPDASTVYPNGSWTLRIAADEGTWKVQSGTYAIGLDVAALFSAKYIKIKSMHDIIKHDCHMEPF